MPHRLRTAALALCLFAAGCHDDPPAAPAPSAFAFALVGRSEWAAARGPLQVLRVTDRARGKVYLIAYHDGWNAESMVVLDAWADPPPAP